MRGPATHVLIVRRMIVPRYLLAGRAGAVRDLDTHHGSSFSSSTVSDVPYAVNISSRSMIDMKEGAGGIAPTHRGGTR
jgi:hypothetical protein